jgi:hypothetical protein
MVIGKTMHTAILVMMPKRHDHANEVIVVFRINAIGNAGNSLRFQNDTSSQRKLITITTLVALRIAQVQYSRECPIFPTPRGPGSPTVAVQNWEAAGH